MNEPKELTGRELLEHAAKLLEAVDNKDEIQLWSTNEWTDWCSDLCPQFSSPLWYFRVKPERKVFYLNVYNNSNMIGHPYDNRAMADMSAPNDRIACLRVEYEDGQYDD